MKIKLIFPVLLFSVLCSIQAQDIRDKIAKGGKDTKRETLIDPNHSILGFDYLAPEDDIISEKGDPQAYIRLDADNTAAVFGNNMAFIFTNGRLTGIRMGYNIIDHHLIQAFSGDSISFRQDWELDNGLKNRMSLDEVREILGDKMRPASDPPSKYHQHYEDGESTIYLYFSRTSEVGSDKFTYILYGLLVKPVE